MNDFTIAIYCFVDDYLQVAGGKAAAKRKPSDAEVITTALLAARYFGGNITTARSYMQAHHRCRMPHKSNFNRALHRLSDLVASLFLALGQSLKELNCSGEYLIDSFPMAVCRNVRINRCRLLQNQAYRGYNASKRECFYSFKVELIATSDGVPVDYFIVAVSVHDARAFEAMHVDCPRAAASTPTAPTPAMSWRSLIWSASGWPCSRSAGATAGSPTHRPWPLSSRR